MGSNTGKPATIATYFAGQGLVNGEPSLLYVEGFKHIPFLIERVFWVDLEPTENPHGNHAHKKCRQIMFSLLGSIEIKLSKINPEKDNEIEWTVRTVIQPGAAGVLIEPYTYISYRPFSDFVGAIALVFASEPYDPDDYITFDEENQVH